MHECSSGVILDWVMPSERSVGNALWPLSANFTKWSNTLEQFVGKLPANCLSVFVYFVGLAPKGLNLNEARYNQEGSLAIWVFQDKVFCKIYYEKEITLY